MSTIMLAVRAGYWHRPLALVRKALSVLRERFAEGRRCAALAAAYRALPAAERCVRGVHTSHRAARAPRVRRQATARAPRGPRHTVRPGGLRPAAPVAGAYRRGHSWRGRETLFTLTHGRAGSCPA
jgi:hypothetical protein